MVLSYLSRSLQVMRYISIFLIILLCGCGSGESSQFQQSRGEPYEVHCTEPLPNFTLGRDSNPTKEQERNLCACIWENLGQWERKVSEKIAQGKDSEISEMYQRAFTYRFGRAVKKCGGMEL
jgi:hypothetical protein